MLMWTRWRLRIAQWALGRFRYRADVLATDGAVVAVIYATDYETYRRTFDVVRRYHMTETNAAESVN